MAKPRNNEIKKIYTHLSVGPEIRDEQPKGVYPKGRFKQVFDTFSAEMNSLMRVNIWFLLFLLPLLAVLVWYSNFIVAKTVVQFNFMGNIGIGYPGGSDDAVKGLVAVYNAYQSVLFIALPAIVIMALGIAGAFNCYKKFLWGEKVAVTKDFFIGIKKFWHKYIIVFSINALLILAEGSIVIYFLKASALGNAGVWQWILLIGVSLVIYLLLYVNMMLLPMVCAIDLPIVKQVKNAFLLSFDYAILGIPLSLLLMVPIVLLFATNSFLNVLLYMVMLMFGFILYGLSFTAFGHLAFDNILTPLYNATIAPKNTRSSKKSTNKKPMAKSKKGGK